MENNKIMSRVRALFDGQKLGVIATPMDLNEPPYINLIAFAHTPDLKDLVFATNRDTKKFANIKNNPKISMLVDNRGNQPSDFKDAVAVSVFGFAEEIKDDLDKYLDLYLSKHPYLEDFARDPKCALLKIEVSEIYYVSQFQKVRILKV